MTALTYTFVSVRPCRGERRSRRIRRALDGASPAFSLAETLMSIALVGGLLVVALNTLGNSAGGQQRIGDRGKGQLLASDLMSEILQQAYEEPDDAPVFGRESSESGGSRVDYDDVDDYDGWSASPPEHKDGTAIPAFNGWVRSVVVEFVSPDDLTVVSGTDQGVKRVTVTVQHGNLMMASLVAVRTAGADVASGS